MTILPLGSCTSLFMSNFIPLLLFRVNVELSSLLSVSFNIDLMCGPWSTGHVFSQEMVRLSKEPESEPLAWFS